MSESSLSPSTSRLRQARGKMRHRAISAAIESLEGRTLLSVTPSLVANRISGVAPLSVNFDATGTTSTATTSPLHEIQYSWDFGDTGSGTWSPSGRSRNSAGGPVAGHVFEQPGTYTVSLNVRDPAGTIGTQSVTITVQDPNTVFSGTNTIVFSTTGNFTGAPAGALQVTTSSVATIASYAAPGKRLLLHRGETWNNAASVTINKLGPGIIGAYGTGAKPTITSTLSNLFSLSGKTHTMEDWRFMDLNLVGATDKIAFLFNGTADRILIDRVDIADFGSGVIAGPSILDYWNSNGATTPHTLYDGNAVVNTTINHGQGGGGDNGMFISGKRLMLMGDSITDMDQVEHVLRTPWLQKSVIADSLISTPASAKHNLKLHAPTWGVAGLGFNKYSEQIVVANNTFQGAANPWTVTIGPQDNTKDERVRDLIFENNFVKSGTGTQVGMLIWAQQVTARNNIFNVDTGDQAFNIGRRGIEPAPANNRIFNNTMRMTSGSGTAVNIASVATNTTVKNNLFAGAGTMISGGGTGLVQSNNLLTATPGFVSATPTVPEDFQLSAGSPAIDAGTAVALWDDFGDNSRPAGNAYDIGAWEYASTPVAPIVMDNTSAGVTITGTWTASTYNPGYQGTNYLHDGNTGKGTKSVRYTPTIASAGNYEVFMWWTASSNRATNTPVDINHTGGTTTVSVNQQLNNAQWVSLGVYSFSAGTAGSVLIRTGGTNGYVIADAVQFVKV